MRWSRAGGLGRTGGRPGRGSARWGRVRPAAGWVGFSGDRASRASGW